jgi:hypothetical protein
MLKIHECIKSANKLKIQTGRYNGKNQYMYIPPDQESVVFAVEDEKHF